MKYIMISQPMGNKTDEEIRSTRDKAILYLKGKGYSIINTWFDDSWFNINRLEILNKENKDIKQRSLFFLAKSLESMSLCDLVYFCKDWEKNRGCQIEHEAAKAYNLEMLYEE